jgi:hypothetical protein
VELARSEAACQRPKAKRSDEQQSELGKHHELNFDFKWRRVPAARSEMPFDWLIGSRGYETKREALGKREREREQREDQLLLRSPGSWQLLARALRSVLDSW